MTFRSQCRFVHVTCDNKTPVLKGIQTFGHEPFGRKPIRHRQIDTVLLVAVTLVACIRLVISSHWLQVRNKKYSQEWMFVFGHRAQSSSVISPMNPQLDVRSVRGVHITKLTYNFQTFDVVLYLIQWSQVGPTYSEPCWWFIKSVQLLQFGKWFILLSC